MDRLNPSARSDEYGSRINRIHSPTFALGIPPLTIMAASIIPFFVLTSAIPFVPPLGFMMLIAWRIVRPGLFPAWIGFPLGAFDDLFSSQPFGSAILLWSLAVIAIEIIEVRFPWRSFVQDWISMSAMIALYIVLAAFLSGTQMSMYSAMMLAPQIIASALLFPVLARLVARMDRLRLKRFFRVN